VIKTIGSSKNEQELQRLWFVGKQEMARLSAQPTLFISVKDRFVEDVFDALQNASVRTVGPELVFGRIYDHIGFNSIEESISPCILNPSLIASNHIQSLHNQPQRSDWQNSAWKRRVEEYFQSPILV
jgi:hypothetical protein